jgi:hypothetical protein
MIIQCLSDIRIFLKFKGSGGFGLGILSQVFTSCSSNPAKLAVPLCAHFNAAFWRFAFLTLGAKL